MYGKRLLAFAVLLTFCQIIHAEYDVDAYCTLVINGIKLGSSDNCQTYYECQNGIGTKYTCSASQSFDRNSQSCRAASDVNCYFGLSQPCEGKDKAFVPVAETCNQYIYCANQKESGRGSCPLNMIFKDGGCEYGDCNSNINQGSNSGGLSSVCEIMPDNKFFGSTVDCETYQQCTAGKLTSGTCPDRYVFDVQGSVCNHKTVPNLCTRVTGQDILPDSPSAVCTATQTGQLRADSKKCSGYFSCNGSKWEPRTCQQNFFYSIVTKNCEVRQLAAPVDTCNRCEFSNNQFVNAPDPECRGYQVCENSVAKSTGYCQVDSYFDEITQACILDKDGYKLYSKDHGACADCNRLCNAQSSTACGKVNTCQCGVVSGKCAACTVGFNEATQECLTCANQCQGLAASACKASEECDCGLNDAGTCDFCANGIDDTGNCITCESICSELSAATCKGVGACYCGLEEVDGETCTACSAPPDADNVCPASCEEVCSALTVGTCEVTGECNCGLDSTGATCELCEGTPTNGYCEGGDDDCTEVCSAQDPCESTDECTCGTNTEGGDCEVCTGTSVDGVCQEGQEDDCETYCSTSNGCTSSADCECGLDGADGDCIVCSGVVESSTSICYTSCTELCSALGETCESGNDDCVCELDENDGCVESA